MNKLNFKKRISLLLAFLMLFSLIVPAGLKAQESENKFVRGYDSWSRYDYEYICQDHIFDEVSQLVNDTWCYNFVGNINFRPGCNFMGVDGTQYELDSEAVPIMEYDKIIIPLNPILEITGEDISLNPLMQRMAIGDEVMMLPVSIIAEYFDFEYYWDEEGKEVILTRPFQTKRLMVRPLVEIDFEHLGPTHVIQSFDNVVYLQFATIEETRAAFDTLLLSNEIEGVGPDLVITRCEKGIQDIVFEPFSASSWDNVGKVGTARYAQYLRSIGRGNYRRVVAVLDTGVQANHPLLDGRVIDGRNVRENSYDTPDPNGHGTHVAGVIIANTPGLNVRIMPIVTACAQGNSTLITMRQGVHWAANRRIDPVDVINISWSVELPWAPSINWGLIAFEDAVNTAINNGITVVVSAGDDRVNVNTLTPARMDRVITVAASTRLSNTFRETNFGVGVCISAPGMDIFGPTINSGDRVRNGTSYATPHVSAAAAMTLIRHPGSSPSSVRTRLRVWTDTPNGWDRNMHGIGILDMTRGIPPSWQPPEGGTPTQPPTTPPALPTHTVTFFPNGGSGGSARYTQNFVHGQAQNLRRNTWTRPGYTFMGWASIPNGNVHYTEGQRVNILASHHLYAVWQIVHTVTFFPNGGSGGSAQYTQNFVHGQAQYLRRNTWQRPGYTFVGWASIPNGNVHYTEGQRVNILASHHLYAVWRPVGRATITSVTTTNNGRVTVNWTSSGNATNYDIYLIQHPWTWNDVRHRVNRPAGTTSHTFTGVASGAYRAFIVARPNADDIQSNAYPFEVLISDRAVITSVNTTNTGEVTVNWNSVPGGAGYRIYILQYPWSWYDIRHQAIRPPGSTSHTFTGVASGAYNVFIVTEPNNRYIQSVWHTFEVVTSDRAVITSVNATSYGRVTVNWNSVPGGEGYRIYIIQYPWSWNDIRHQAVRPPGTTSHTFTGVANGEYNVFIVTQPNNRYIQSVWRTFEVRPPARAVITGVNVSGRNVTVNWNSVPGVASYDIYIIQAPWSWNDIRHHANRVPGTTSHTFTGLLPGRYYVFIVTRPNDRYTQSIWHRIDIS